VHLKNPRNLDDIQPEERRRLELRFRENHRRTESPLTVGRGRIPGLTRGSTSTQQRRSVVELPPIPMQPRGLLRWHQRHERMRFFHRACRLRQNISLPLRHGAWRFTYPTDAESRFQSSDIRWTEAEHRVEKIEAIRLNDSLRPTKNARGSLLVTLVRALSELVSPKPIRP